MLSYAQGLFATTLFLALLGFLTEGCGSSSRDMHAARPSSGASTSIDGTWEETCSRGAGGNSWTETTTLDTRNGTVAMRGAYYRTSADCSGQGQTIHADGRLEVVALPTSDAIGRLRFTIEGHREHVLVFVKEGALYLESSDDEKPVPSVDAFVARASRLERAPAPAQD